MAVREAVGATARAARESHGRDKAWCARRVGKARVWWIRSEDGTAPVDPAALEVASPQIAATFYRRRLDALEQLGDDEPLVRQARVAVVAAAQLLATLDPAAIEASPRETLEQLLVLVRRAGDRLRSLERAIAARLAELRRP